MKLEDINKKNIFKEPEEGYFDKLPHKIRERIDQDKPQEVMSPWLNWKMASVAAMLFVIAGVWLINSNNQPMESDPLANVSEEAILFYLEKNGVTTEEVVSYADVDELIDEPAFDEDEALEGLNFLDYELEDELDFM